jgi:hypothetical protein
VNSSYYKTKARDLTGSSLVTIRYYLRSKRLKYAEMRLFGLNAISKIPDISHRFTTLKEIGDLHKTTMGRLTKRSFGIAN